MVVLPEEFVVSKFYQYTGSPKYSRSSNLYQGSCPICREGKSWLKKQRCYYVVKKNIIHCHNCGWHGNPINWIMELSGDSFSEVLNESKNYDTINIEEFNSSRNDKKPLNYELPCDCIDLEDQEQLEFFHYEPAVKKALEILNERRLLSAINRPKKYYVTLNDFVHENRLIVPFYDENNKIVFYQSRKLLDYDQKAKYLSKKNAERSIFNVDKIDENIPYIFVTEGPLDSTFIRNGIALAGISDSGSETFTEKQKNQLKLFPLHEIIFVLDNQWNDSTSKKKSRALLDFGKKVFIWPKEYIKYKDINEVCMAYELDEFPYKFIYKHSFSGMTGKLTLECFS
jgi:hypothetical protein